MSLGRQACSEGRFPAMPTAIANVCTFFLFFLPCTAASSHRMLLWNLRLYSHRSSWFEIIAAVFYDLNLKRLAALDRQDDDFNAWDADGAQEGEAS